jgi:predicted porin
MKKLLAIAVAAALVAPAAAMAETTLYGKLHASYGEVKDNAGNKVTGIESHSSRIGVKGSHALNNGLEATYGVEYGIDLDGDTGGGTVNGRPTFNTDTTVASKSLSARNTFVGLKGSFGEVRAGRHDTPAKLATAGQDVFGDTYADMANIVNVDGHRVDNAVAYINKVGPVGFAVAHSTGPAGADNTSNANSAMINYGNGPWYAGLGYTKVDNSALAVGTADSIRGGIVGTQFGKHVNLGLGWKAEAGHQVNLVLEQSKDANGGSGKNKVALINGVAKVGAVGLKAQYGESKDSGYPAGSNGKEKLASIGMDYSLGKKTSVYLLHSQNKNPNRVEGDSYKVKSTAVGLVTEF